MRITKIIFAFSLHLAMATFCAAEIKAQQVSDPDFKPPLEKPPAEAPRTNRLIESYEPNSSVTEHTTKSLGGSVAESADSAGSDRLSQKSRST
jgi:hypothetical protein